MSAVVVVDDRRVFEDVEATYLRSLKEAQAWLDGYLAAPYPVELWLDHDLGDGTVQPFVERLEAALAQGLEEVRQVRVVTMNPVGRAWLFKVLGRHVPVGGRVGRWRLHAEQRDFRSPRSGSSRTTPGTDAPAAG